MRWKSTLRVGIADLAVFVQVEDADVGQFFAIQQFVEVAGEPFQVGPLLPEAVDPGRVEIDADKAAGRQGSFAFQQVEGQQAGRAHQLAPVAAEPGAVAVLPEQEGGFAQDAEVAFAAGGFRGVVEGVVLAVGEVLVMLQVTFDATFDQAGQGETSQEVRDTSPCRNAISTPLKSTFSRWHSF